MNWSDNGLNYLVKYSHPINELVG